MASTGGAVVYNSLVAGGIAVSGDSNRWIRFVLSAGYSIGQITLGLLLHPYQTMQSLVEDGVFVWMTLLPTAVLAVVILLWRLLIVPVVQLVFSCQGGGGFAVLCGTLPFLSDWLMLFCLYWQVLLLYLLVRFHSVFSRPA